MKSILVVLGIAGVVMAIYYFAQRPTEVLPSPSAPSAANPAIENPNIAAPRGGAALPGARAFVPSEPQTNAPQVHDPNSAPLEEAQQAGREPDSVPPHFEEANPAPIEEQVQTLPARTMDINSPEADFLFKEDK